MPFTIMQTLKFKAQPTNAFFSTVNQMLGNSSRLDNCALNISQKLGGAVGHLIDGSENTLNLSV